jgi:uncharacterized membrane protein YsdA (DUF1294 family)/cold shock CspA family protein
MKLITPTPSTNSPGAGTPEVRRRGRIVEWNDDRGFGFVLGTDRQRTFLHIRDFGDRIKRPAVGDVVSFSLGSDTNGRTCAKQIEQEGWGGGFGPGAFLILIALLVAPALAVRRFIPADLWLEVGIFASVVSLFTFGMYAWDKRKARRQEWRLSESTLQLWSIIGGWPGAFLAQRLLRHKSSKTSFQFVFWATVMLHQYVMIDALLDWRLFHSVRVALSDILQRLMN